MTTASPRFRLAAAVVIGAMLAIPFTFWPRTKPPQFYFTLKMRPSTSGFAQLYYGIGSAANEADSFRLPVEANLEAEYKFPLPEGRHLNLRFDPTDQARNTMTLSHARIVDWSGRLIRVIEPYQITPLQQIERFKASDTEVTLSTSRSGNDPILTVTLESPVILKSFGASSARTLLRRFLISFLLSAGAGFLAAPMLLPRMKRPGLFLSRKLANWPAKQPLQLLLVTAAAAVVLSCYPIVFCGKSFLSPNNHSHTCLLYGEMPTVPGSHEVATDNEQGSDLGAAMWYSWPASVIESRALWKHFELPLWNRYDSSGLPLLGQGQSMFGDPLHFPVLLTNGSPLVWDLKYLLAKCVFAASLGLCVLQLTRHLPAAVIITASAPFIGFFSYRYSHPAFFSMCYAPFVLLCWFKFIDARPGRSALLWLGLMVLANWMLMNSGTVKEAYILLLAMNLCGCLTLLLANSVVGKTVKLRQALFAQALFLLISTPIWLTFLNTLTSSWTVYDAGAVFQIPPGRLIGLFDDIFYWQFQTNGRRLNPSANFLVLLGVLWFCLSWRRAHRRALALGLIITCVLALVFAFGVVPPSLILQVPFINRIYHIGNIFSCIAIICLLVLAGFGFKAFWSDCQTREFKRTYLRFLICLAALFALYLGTTSAAPHPGFFWGYCALLLVATALVPWIGRLAIKGNFRQLTPIAGLALLFILLQWRHGMHLATPFDSYVMNPHQRTDLFAKSSPALQLIRTAGAEPFRSVGLKYNLFPGYGGAVGVEQIDAADPLLNRYYKSLMDASGLKLPFGSAEEGEIRQDDLENNLAFFDMLNVRYFLGYAGGQDQIGPSLKRIGALDLDVYESSTAWPRAFFAHRLIAYTANEEFVRLLRNGDGRPLAAIPLEELNKHPELGPLASNPTPSTASPVISAKAYSLTTNTTSFEVDAPNAGVIVLTEPYVEGDFQLRVNGRPESYFRVNSAFRGVFLPAAGEYHFAFSYWPRHLTLSLWISGFGILLLLLWIGSAFKHSDRQA